MAGPEHGDVESDAPTRVDADETPSREIVRGLTAPRHHLVDWLKDQVESQHAAKLGRYALLRVLGEGGMGVVFAAYDQELDRKVAIKLLRTRARGSQWDESWLRNEAKAMARLSHPNIVQVYDVGQEEATLFVAMEFVVGVSLRSWWKRSKRSLRETLDTCTQAGRGLQAAHDSGLVHCDFKPQNVLVGKDGRVRVLDFGVAQLREATRAAPTDVTASDSRPHTRLAGTPAYMAPELHQKSVPTARSDQFAFCVTLYEALYGQRPFVGLTVADLREAIVHGKLAPTPDTKVPPWLRRVLLRGLALDPAARWPSMAALLAELGRDRGRAARRWGLALGAAALLGLAASNVHQRRSYQAELEAHRCDATAGLAGAWDDERRAAVHQAILASGLHFADDTARRVAARLDAYAAAWSAMRTAACEQNRSGAQSDLLYERRVACLEQRRADLAALVDVYSAADRDVVTKAVRASAELRPLSPCADAELLLGPVVPPATEQADAEVRRLRAVLATVRAELSAGKIKPARERLAAADPAIAATTYRPLIAEAQFLVGLAEQTLGDYKAAVAAYEAALWAAEASRHDQVAAEAAIRLALVVGYHQSRLDESALWERLAAAALERRGGPRELEPRWLAARGTVRLRAGQADEAAALMTAALAAAERINGPNSFEAALLLGNLGSIAGTRGDMATAIDISRRALAAAEAQLGPDHPDVATVCANTGAAALGRGDFKIALEHLERARGILERSVGADHPDVARIYNNLGSVHARLGDYDQALALQTRSLELRRRLLGANHTDTANSEGNIADTLLQLARPDEALAHVDRALAGHLASVGDQHNRYGAALALRGRIQLARAEPRLALADLTRGLEILTAGATPREQLGDARFGLARALLPSKRPQSLELAHQAAADYAAAGPAFTREQTELRAWLAEHDPEDTSKIP